MTGMALFAIGTAWSPGPARSAGTEAPQSRTLLALPPVPIPAENPSSEAKEALGEKLFFDPRLSADGTVSCESCHRADRAFSDGQRFSTGVGSQLGIRNAPSILNAAYAPQLLWDGRALGLEDQVRYPITDPREMNMTKEKLVQVLTGVPEYPPRFAAAFGDPEVSLERVSQALAAFERTLVSGNSPFDRFYFGKNESALTAAARRGWELFRGKAGCIQCHHCDATNPFFTDFGFHNTGVGFEDDQPDLGRFRVTREREDKGRFKTPSLRNVSLTAPYMHDGRVADLAAVVAFYERGGTPNPFLDERIRPLELTAEEKEDLIQFLSSLEGEPPPARPPVTKGADR
jgi:cytochrome c peroxidase